MSGLQLHPCTEDSKLAESPLCREVLEWEGIPITVLSVFYTEGGKAVRLALYSNRAVNKG